MKDNKPLEIKHLPLAKLSPNNWNCNKMSEQMEQKLRAYVQQEGLVQAVVARPIGKDQFEIVDGYHRFEIAKKLGFKTIPCVILNLDDKRARILSINMNELKGQPVQNLLAEIIHDLNKESPLEDLEKILPYSREELDDTLELLRLPMADLEKTLEEEARQAEEQMPVVVQVVLDQQQNKIFEQALGKAFEKIGMRKNRKATAVTMMAQALLDIQ